jgi:hypothetical protein
MGIPRKQRTSKDRPCPKCGRQSWCYFLAAGDAVWCGRESHGGRPCKGGWIHKLDGATSAAPATRPPAAPVDRTAIAKFARDARRTCTTDQVRALAQELAVGPDALERLGAGWATWEQVEALDTRCNHRGLWTFPMSRPMDPRPAVVGVRVRTPDHKGKFSVTGSDGSGLFIPTGLQPRGLLIAPEGPTSTAALLTAGFAAVGRPNCRAGGAYLGQLCRRLRPATLVILGDNDLKDDGRWPGREGAEAVAAELEAAVADTRVVLPPDGVKDARDWLARDGPQGLRVGLWRAIEAAGCVATA